MAKSSFWDHPIEKLEEALSLKRQIHALQAKLSNLFGGDGDDADVQPSLKTTGKRGGKRTVSPAARAKMAAAQRARWAKRNAGKAVSAVTSSAPAKKGRKKRVLSPEGRARIVAALKARHAARRAAKSR